MSNTADDALLAEVNSVLGHQPSVAHTSTPPVVQAEWWSTTNAMTMCSAILLFGLIVIALSGWLIRSGQQASAVLRVFGTILVIVMATFLVVAGYDDKQIGAPLGLLGTIVGYLLGRDSSSRSESSNTSAKGRDEG